MEIRIKVVLFFVMAFHFMGGAQNVTGEILVQPYLQDAEPNSIKIMWETSLGEESLVEWG
ncbi:hypothetical protein MWU78_14075 [Arenibacter sp. F26102]|uniref:hypothetical protein n=1 Tax=Arenibacter sp. F26102 TaxID=2926416 RepID=UPI001FF446BE|nr:hypothetical protein [Arenibacter sp. F26102]MCK0146780.1 hypothetical protein [Arenibacter sp. F26102]